MTTEELYHVATAHGHPVAVWRRPHAAAPEAVAALTPDILAGQPPRLENGPAGFAFFPFADSDQSPTIFLPADLYHSGAALSSPTELPLAAALARLRLPAAPGLTRRPVRPPELDAAHYQRLVAEGVAFMRSGGARKVVPSRPALRPLPDGFDAYAAFEKLRVAYPRAFVSLVHIPAFGQVWLGASPEVLAQVADGRTFETVALAGTQPLPPDTLPEDARWSQKEIEEQANVTRYVIGCFKQLRLREYLETGPRTVQAGHLVHLQTHFAVDLRQVPFPTLGTDMLRLLHPTSAVGGMPREAALRWLHAHEGYDRAYYSGFLGPVNLPDAGTSALYVNLRCVQVLTDSKEAILYAGAGLTVASDPAREWAETEQKLRVVADVVL